MATAQTVSGVLTDPQTIRLDRPLPFDAGPVRVTVEVVAGTSAGPKPSLTEFLDDLHRRRAEQGVPPLTEAEIDAWVADIRAGRGG